MAEVFQCALVILAAGGSRRMGQPKQLLPIGDRPLLRHIVEAGVSPLLSSVIVVLGANSTLILPSLAGLPIHLIVNEGWEEGLGSSIRVGMQALLALAPKTEGVIISLADQPRFSSKHVSQLINAHHRTNRSIVASCCSGKLMSPALFTSAHFPALLAMARDVGASSLFGDNPNELADIPANDLGDLDTPDDYREYVNRGNGAS